MASNLSDVSFTWEEIDLIVGNSTAQYQEEDSFGEFERLLHSTPNSDMRFEFKNDGGMTKTAKRRLVFEDSIETEAEQQRQSQVLSETTASENGDMLFTSMDQTLHALCQKKIEKMMPQNSKKKSLKIFMLHKALAAVTPTILRELTRCLAVQGENYYQGNNSNPFCQDLFDFLTSRTKAAEQKLQSHNHSLVLPESM